MKACKAMVKAEMSKCRLATNPTPPGCSPSGAFLN
jgi:hypothetical protein